MRRVGLVLGASVVMATMMILAGTALAKTTNQNQHSYTDSFNGYEYYDAPPSGGTPYLAQFRAEAKGDLKGELDASIYYTGGAGPNFTDEITDGTWILCSEFTSPPRDPISGALIEPVCTSDSKIQLTGTWKRGTAVWDATGQYVEVYPEVWVWAGKAQFEATLDVSGGTVKGVPVKGGSGKVEGTLDQTNIPSVPPMISGTMTLTLKS